MSTLALLRPTGVLSVLPMVLPSSLVCDVFQLPYFFQSSPLPLASIVRAIGPTFATSLFAFSAQHQLLSGYFVYVVLGLLTLIAVRVSWFLPKDAWDADETQD